VLNVAVPLEIIAKKNDWKPYDHFIYFVNYYVKMISFVAIVHKQPVRLAGG
jgi:hypothetical protein